MKSPITNLPPYFIYGFSSRSHGNMSPLRGEAECVRTNQHNFLSRLGILPSNTVKCRLSHSTNIKIVTHQDCGTGILKNTSPLPDTDGLITAEPEVFLFMVTADCVPVLLFNPPQNAVGLFHAGWKGTLHQITPKGIRIMEDQLNCDPQKTIAILGPSICSKCYEIGDDLAGEFNNTFPNHSHHILFKHNNKYHLDLWKTLFYQLLESGLSEDNIHLENRCTKCNPKEFYSARAQGIETGRFASVIGIKKIS